MDEGIDHIIKDDAKGASTNKWDSNAVLDRIHSCLRKQAEQGGYLAQWEARMAHEKTAKERMYEMQERMVVRSFEMTRTWLHSVRMALQMGNLALEEPIVREAIASGIEAVQALGEFGRETERLSKAERTLVEQSALHYRDEWGIWHNASVKETCAALARIEALLGDACMWMWNTSLSSPSFYDQMKQRRSREEAPFEYVWP